MDWVTAEPLLTTIATKIREHLASAGDLDAAGQERLIATIIFESLREGRGLRRLLRWKNLRVIGDL